MKIFGDVISGNCLKVKYTADYLGIPYEWVPIDILKQQAKTAEFLNLNPAGQVPVIELDDGRPLSQSNAIIQYLAAGSQLLPENAFERAKINELLFWEQYSHEPYVAVCRFVMRYQGKRAGERELWRVERGEAALNYMENWLMDRDWFVSGRISIADIALLAYARLAHGGGFDLSERPRVIAWIDRCVAELSIQD